MATVRGAIRSYGAAVRRIEREQQKQAREAAKKFKEQQKLKEIKNAQQAVADWENYIDTIQSLHKNCTEPVDWDQIADTEEPIEPLLQTTHETVAQYKLDNFKPSFFDKVFGSTQKKINKFSLLVEQAKQKDQKEFDLAYKDYLEELKNHKELKKIYSGLKNKNPESYKEALQYFDPFSDVGELGTQVNIHFQQKYIDIDLHVNSVDVIPDYELRLTSTDKLSRKNMSKSRYNELYQDHICSAAMRVAREVFAYLPIDYARINAMAQLVNTKTGHLEEQPILSVIFPPETIASLNLNAIDPSDSMRNFVHHMNFNKTKGFSVIEKVELDK